jgi:outer membrane protein assembly factor BamB
MGRPSVVVILLGSIIGIGVIVMAASGSANVALDAKNGRNIWEVNADLFVCNE